LIHVDANNSERGKTAKSGAAAAILIPSQFS